MMNILHVLEYNQADREGPAVVNPDDTFFIVGEAKFHTAMKYKNFLHFSMVMARCLGMVMGWMTESYWFFIFFERYKYKRTRRFC